MKSFLVFVALFASVVGLPALLLALNEAAPISVVEKIHGECGGERIAKAKAIQLCTFVSDCHTDWHDMKHLTEVKEEAPHCFTREVDAIWPEEEKPEVEEDLDAPV